MSRKDRVSGKVSLTGNNRSKALNITKRSWHFNIQTITYIDKQGNKRKITASAKTLRTMRRKGII